MKLAPSRVQLSMALSGLNDSLLSHHISHSDQPFSFASIYDFASKLSVEKGITYMIWPSAMSNSSVPAMQTIISNHRDHYCCCKH